MQSFKIPEHSKSFHVGAMHIYIVLIYMYSICRWIIHILYNYKQGLVKNTSEVTIWPSVWSFLHISDDKNKKKKPKIKSIFLSSIQTNKCQTILWKKIANPNIELRTTTRVFEVRCSIYIRLFSTRPAEPILFFQHHCLTKAHLH